MLVFCSIDQGLKKVDLKDESIVEIVNFSADYWSRVTQHCIKKQMYCSWQLATA
jgi:hypothetical protein